MASECSLDPSPPLSQEMTICDPISLKSTLSQSPYQLQPEFADGFICTKEHFLLNNVASTINRPPPQHVEMSSCTVHNKNKYMYILSQLWS